MPSPPPATLHARSDTAKVLIVDDDPVTVDFVRKQLGALGYRHFVTCSDSRQAMELVAREKPDVILLDILMPQVSGLEILQRIRASDETAHLPVIILTVLDDMETRVKALELGATDFVGKPINFVELAPRVRNALIVKAHHDQLKRYAQDLERQVDLQTARLRQSHAELQKANMVLRQSCEVAQAATRAKSEFLAKISHEIRTPLTAILGFAEELLADAEREQMPGERTEMLRAIWRNGRVLLEIVNDILDVARIEKGQLRIHRTACSPSAVLSEVVRLMKPLAEAKRLDLQVESVGPIPATIHSDPIRLQQILTNLVSNAIKFTERGFVRVVMSLQGADSPNPLLQFEVIDTGSGIESDQILEIFKPFVQGEGTGPQPAPGAGLGLTISRYLVEQLGGTIQVESEPGKGSVFRVTVDTGPLPKGSSVLDENTGRQRDSETESQRAAASPLPEPLSTSLRQALRDCRVLVAEDCPDNQRFIVRVLQKAGAEVVTVFDGQAAWQKALEAQDRGEPFDIVLTDIQMPRIDGYDLARRLREAGYSGRIIALTANAMPGEREKCLAAGCDDYLSKPIRREELIALVVQHARPARRSEPLTHPTDR